MEWRAKQPGKEFVGNAIFHFPFLICHLSLPVVAPTTMKNENWKLARAFTLSKTSAAGNANAPSRKLFQKEPDTGETYNDRWRA